MTLDEAAQAYVEKFHDCPTIMGIPPNKIDEATELLRGAVEDDRPFLDDDDFYNSMDLDAPDKDVET